MSESTHELPADLRTKLVAICERVRGQLGVEVAALCRRHGRFGNQIWQLAETLTGLRRTGEVQDPKPTSGVHRDPRGGTYIGPYRIVKPLGKGGMGVVFLAEQSEPVKRQVAVKVIRGGVDIDQVLGRFALERQALAVMNHRSIARVYEAGETSDGAPYFVMEYVPGVPIDEYCESKSLSLADRLVLFQQVCAGVQHAHQKGVIHRDLTARNVLVTEEEGKPVPKIIDFGLARATDMDLAQKSMCTEAGLVVGTPEYMSPEQINPGQDIDTRTDVYSLGVLLYHILTCSLPFPSEALRRGGFAELQRMIVEQDPPRPSLTVELLASDAAQTLAHRRQTSVSNLLQQLRNDLDWVVLKCLEKDRNARYETPSELASEIERYLSDEPLLAGPPSTGYRLRKLLRRHKRRVVAAGAVAATLVAGMLGTTHGLLSAKANASVAEANAARAHAEKIEADRQRERANQNAVYVQQQSERLRHQTILALAARQLVTDPWLALAFVREVPAESPLAPASLQVAHDALSACDGNWRCMARLLGHEGKVMHLALSSDGTRIASTARDGTVRVFKGTAAPVVLSHPDEVTHALFTPNGLSVLTACRDGVLRLWGSSGSDRPVQFSPDTNLPRAVLLDPAGERFVTLAADGVARAWDTRRPAADPRTLGTDIAAATFSPDGQRLLLLPRDSKLVRLLPADGDGIEREVRHEAVVQHACFAPDAARVLTASADGTVKLTPVDTAGAAVVLQHPAGVQWGAYSADGSTVYTLAADQIVRAWSAHGGGARAGYHDGDAAVQEVALSADGLRLATRCADHVVRVWDVATAGKPVAVLPHDVVVTSVSFAGDRIVTVAADRRVRSWEIGWARPARVLAHPGDAEAVALHTPSGRMVTAAVDGALRIWERVASSQPVHLRQGVGVATALCSTDTHVAVGSQSGSVAVFALATGDTVATLQGHPRAVLSLAFSPDGATLASGAEDGSVRCTSLAGSWPAADMKGHTAAVSGICFSPNGDYIATASHDGTARLWQRDGSGEARVLRGHNWQVVAVRFASDSETLATASWDGTVRVWRTRDGTELAVLRHPDKVLDLACSPDGKRIATACEDGVARVFSADGTGTPVRLQGHTRAIRHVSFSADGALLLTAAVDHTARAWRSDGEGTPLVLRGHGDEVVCAALSPDGKQVLTVSLDQTARIWNLEPAHIAAPQELTMPLVLRHRDAVLGGSFTAQGRRGITLCPDGARTWSLQWPELRRWLLDHVPLTLSPLERASFATEGIVPSTPPR